MVRLSLCMAAVGFSVLLLVGCFNPSGSVTVGDGWAGVVAPPPPEPKNIPAGAEHAACRLEMSRALQQIESLQDDNAELADKVKRLEKENSALEDKIDDLEDQVDDLKDANEDLQDRIKDLQAR